MTSVKEVYDGVGIYGLHSSKFTETGKDRLYGNADFFYQSAFRFIGADENDGNRWSVGDTIDMFSLDFENTKFTETE